jgi:DNA-binding NtrC family response regulator
MRLLLADDNPLCCDIIQSIASSLESELEVVQDGKSLIEALATNTFHALFLDINLPEADGFELLQKVRNLAPDVKVVVISGSIGIPETVRAMKLGAFDCLTKPLNVQELQELLTRLAGLVASLQGNASQSDMIAVSQPMRKVRAMIGNVAKSRATTVLITGETGTGKEVVANRLHKCSDRRDKPFVAVNCSAIPASLIESELFGHEKGAFTDARGQHKGYFEMAGDGTIFLDEIGDMPLELQSKLLRVLQERAFRRVGGTQEIPLLARVVAATNRNLAQEVRRGQVREDLYYRLAIIPIDLLPLRDRPDDIIPLAKRFLTCFAQEMKCDPPELKDEHCHLLQAHAWPGNVRELRNVMERFVVMNGHLEFVASTRDLQGVQRPQSAEEFSSTLSEAERNGICDLLLKKLLAEERQTSSRRSPMVLNP